MSHDEYDELEPLSDVEIDKYLGGKTTASKRLGKALKNATAAQKAKAYALLEKTYHKCLSTTEELSIVRKALDEFDKGNYSHLAIYRYLGEKADEIF